MLYGAIPCSTVAHLSHTMSRVGIIGNILFWHFGFNALRTTNFFKRNEATTVRYLLFPKAASLENWLIGRSSSRQHCAVELRDYKTSLTPVVGHNVDQRRLIAAVDAAIRM